MPKPIKEVDSNNSDSINIFLQFLYTIMNFLLLVSQRTIQLIAPKQENNVTTQITSSPRNENISQESPPTGRALEQPLQPRSVEDKKEEKPKETQSTDSINTNKPPQQPTPAAISVTKKHATKKPQKPTNASKKKNLKQKINSSKIKLGESFTIEEPQSKQSGEQKEINEINESRVYYFFLLPNELIIQIALLLNFNDKLSLRGTSKKLKELSDLITVGKDKLSFFKPIDPARFLYDAFLNEPLFEKSELEYFVNPKPIPNNFYKLIESKFKALSQKYQNNNNQLNDRTERQLFRFYRSFMTPQGIVDPIKLKQAITSLRHSLYENKLLQYKVVFIVENTQSDKSVEEKRNNKSIQNVLNHWKEINGQGHVEFSVDPYRTLFYTMNFFPSLKGSSSTSFISILIIPTSQFETDQSTSEYKNKTDYSRTFERFSSNVSSKLKQTNIGSATYSIDPACRVVTIAIESNTGKLKDIAFNPYHHLGIDIAITQNPKISLSDKEVLNKYLTDFAANFSGKKQDLVVSNGKSLPSP